MPKGRMLNKKICCSEKVAQLSLPATILYTWGISHQDCEGRIYGNPEQIKGVIAPHIKQITLKNIPDLLNEMVDAGLIVYYGNDRCKYVQYIGFEGEQKVNKDREAPSVIPAPTQEQLQSNSGVTPAKVKLSKVKLSKDKSEKKFSDADFSLAEKLKTKILTNCPKEKISDKQVRDWADVVRLMRQIDGRSPDEITLLINFVHGSEEDKIEKHSFWYRNIRSMDKLRKQFGQLWDLFKDSNPTKIEAMLPVESHQLLAIKEFLNLDNKEYIYPLRDEDRQKIMNKLKDENLRKVEANSIIGKLFYLKNGYYKSY